MLSEVICIDLSNFLCGVLTCWAVVAKSGLGEWTWGCVSPLLAPYMLQLNS